ncbi:transmembrane protein 94-like [Amphibalanus amphitrite]|uniref:transmembrane protein 94-like n=1 Tax=Amphibalanus amphitrite TaxID=1232801 RepID=UPI001C9222A5|nr:transmembrane protein 94-like [Amphibalanus amphitrite]
MASVHQQLNGGGSARDGLSTAEALRRLRDDMVSALEERRRGQRRGWLATAALQRRVWFSWPVLVLSALVAVALVTSAALAEDGGASEAVAAALVLALAAANAALSVWQRALADGELAAKAGRLAERLGRAAEAAAESGGWTEAEYPHLHAPPSPCIGLQWTYRDGRLVNLPASLLTRGDLVVLRPGEAALADVESVSDEPPLRLLRLEQYVPGAGQRSDEKLTHPRLVSALPNRRFRVLSSPYLESLQLALSAEERPAPPPRRELERLLAAVLMAALPTALVSAVLVAVPLQLWLLPETVVGLSAHIRLLLQRICGCLLPVLPLPCSLVLVPAAWLAQARLVALAREMRQPRPDDRRQLDVLDETSVHEHVAAHWRHVWPVLRDTASGRCDSLPHTASLLYTLGALTSLCCVDKKGVLSWPNPTAEKVVTVRLKSGGGDEPAAASDGASDVSDADIDPVVSDAALDVLDLTRDNPAEPWSIQFDDPHWRDSLSRLKPIGLAVLVNTCSDQTLADYWRFCRHMVCLAHGEADLVPVPARRCLCQLARQIGFSKRAADAFQLESQMACYKHLKLDPVRRNKLTRAFSFSKIRFPYPHMNSVILRELYTNSLQLVSQGTADLVLDSCSDFWDGTDVIPLSEADRRRILDFYHRHSVTMYCSAFAYRPLTSRVAVELSERYLELPEQSGHIYRAARSPLPGHGLSLDTWPDKPVHPQYMSTDSLYGSEVVDVDSTEGLIQVQCNQIFTGMVTMQYQALADMVRLIDHLEKACIRFVHFSKENELRSRVFSEKMGLESGWNCHISLLDDGSHHGSCAPTGDMVQHPSVRRLASNDSADSRAAAGRTLERLRPLSVSAPSVINLDVDQSADSEEEECCPAGGGAGDGLDQADGRIRVQSECVCPATEPGGSVGSVELLEEPVSPAASRSASRITDSSDQSDPVNFDMSNRAKLPKGIAQIRPHLEHVDNVPLQVSLFTDCTPATTRAMLQIMQEYGEVVCVLGSSGSPQNAGVFLQADAALAVRPLHPQLCSMMPEPGCPSGDPHTATGADTTAAGGGQGDGADGEAGRQPLLPPSLSTDGPVALAERLDSLPCALTLRRDDAVSLTQLVLEARHLVQRLRTAVTFWACQAITLAALAVLSSVLLLPPPLPAGHLLWITCVQLPVLSGALLAAPVDRRIMDEAQDRCQSAVTWPHLVYAGWCYGLRLLPSLLAALAFFGLSLHSVCPSESCHYVYPPTELRPIQDALLVLIVLYACVSSAGFVHRRAQLWQRWPCASVSWSVAVAISLFLAVVFVLLDCAVYGQQLAWPVAAAPWLAAAALAGPLLQLLVTELVKRQEFKYNIRYQKRARLEFDTKLGMNSPF